MQQACLPAESSKARILSEPDAIGQEGWKATGTAAIPYMSFSLPVKSLVNNVFDISSFLACIGGTLSVYKRKIHHQTYNTTFGTLTTHERIQRSTGVAAGGECMVM